MNKQEVGAIIHFATKFSHQLVDHTEEDFDLRSEMWLAALNPAITYKFAKDVLIRYYKNNNWPITPAVFNDYWREFVDDEYNKHQAQLTSEAKRSFEQDNTSFVKELRARFPVPEKIDIPKVKRFTDAELAEIDRKKNASIMHLQIETYLEEQSNG
jgi:hypothetical protein